MNGNPERPEVFELPAAPAVESGAVKVWSQPVSIKTYEPAAPDRNPMFLERRVYQGSSGRIYPLPFIDRIATEPTNKQWQAFHIENEYLRIMVLPEIGGRIHVGLDKTNNHDFFYRQNVIKPALVGLAGPWISGGVEFNWPQHHRPATFMPVEVHIERSPDGSSTVWCGDHDPLQRMKAMHGICLHPGKALVELKVRLYNRTPFTQTFLWWANMAVRVHELYQSVFPEDVHFVADHAKRAMSHFPLCTGKYYGVDYGGRAQLGVPIEERPKRYVPPPGLYAPNDLSWYANIPVPTSYMAIGSREDFFGGYDHAKDAGFVHIANHHIAPGKKQWTWGNHDFGYAWDRNLTDSDGPYVELMAGVYTDNQPDFSFLAPGETKTFSQYWMPIQRIGPPVKANVNAAASVTFNKEGVDIGVCVSHPMPQASIAIETNGEELVNWEADLVPGSPFLRAIPGANIRHASSLMLTVTARNGEEIISYATLPETPLKEPEPAAEPDSPEQIASTDELYLTGLHLEQYRHATRKPEDYWREALRRDPEDSRCNNALGLKHLRRGEFEQAAAHFERAIGRLTRRNPNPYDGEPFYNLGLTRCFQSRYDDAYAGFYKASWNASWRSPAYQALAEIDIRRGQWSAARDHLNESLRTNASNLQARNLLAIALQETGSAGEAEAVLRQTLAVDPLDQWARYLADGIKPYDNQLCLDLAFDFARAGLYQHAQQVLETAETGATDGSAPMILYTLGYFRAARGDHQAASSCYRLARAADPAYCFPARLEEFLVLQAALAADPGDSRAPYFLGTLLYDRARHIEAISLWELSAQLDPSFPTVWRNLGIAYFNVLLDPSKAEEAFERAWSANPADGRVLYERDQLAKRIGISPAKRLDTLKSHESLVSARDDLSVELATLYNLTGQPEQALAVLMSRRFQPWEGGEGLVLEQYVHAQLALGRRLLLEAKASEARFRFEEALQTPENLGEARHLLANQSNVHYWLGVACQALGDEASALEWFRRAASATGDFQQMSVRRFSEMTYYSARALERLGRSHEAERLLTEIQSYGQQLEETKGEIDYFATSLPAMLLFHEDLHRRNTIAGRFLQVQALSAMGSLVQMERLLSEILECDPNHLAAATWLEELQVEQFLNRSAMAQD